MNAKRILPVVCLGLGLGLTLALLWLLGGLPAARAADIPCSASIQACIDAASPGDTILISAGTYTESLTLSKAVSLTGASAATTIINAVSGQRVLTVTGASISNTVVISGLTFANGQAGSGSPTDCGADGINCGGGLVITGTAQPLLVNLVIANNTAAFEGGGLYAASGSPLTLVNVAVLSNTTTVTGTVSPFYGGHGGGVYAWNAIMLTGGLFQNNQCADSGCYGGGLYATTLTMNDTRFISNTAQSNGGGATANAAYLTRGLFQGNQAISPTNGAGGGLAVSSLTLTDTQFLSNTAGAFGGGASVGSRRGPTALAPLAKLGATLTGGLFQGNQTFSTTAGTGGGGLAVQGTLSLSGTQFLGNNSAADGGGAGVMGDAILTGGLFQNNQSSHWGGGLAQLGDGTTVRLYDTQFLSNTTSGDGGGMYANGNCAVEGGLFQNNRANRNGGGLAASRGLRAIGAQLLGNSAASGGGIYHIGSSQATVLDVVLARNSASENGAALYFGSSNTAQLEFTTIASPTLGAGSAIYVYSGTVNITNTLVASYTTGIENGGAATVTQDYNLFFAATTPTSGTVSGGAHNPSGNPALRNPAGDDYHLTVTSAAINKGMKGSGDDVGGEDIEFNPRGVTPDIGAYEYPKPDLDLVKTVTQAGIVPGQAVTFTLTFTNTGYAPATQVVITDAISDYISNVTYTTQLVVTDTGASPAYVWNVQDIPTDTVGVITLTGVLSNVYGKTVFTNTASLATFLDSNPDNDTSNAEVELCSWIQCRIDAANPGDTVNIPAGVYTESLTLNKAVSLVGAGAASTIINAVSGQRVITVTGADISNTVVISGLTFAQGQAGSGSQTDCGADLSNCGGGLVISDTAQPLLENLVIANNTAAHEGGGLYANTGSPLTLVNVAVLSNTSTGAGAVGSGGHGGGVYANGAVTLTGGLFRNNLCTYSYCYGGGLYADILTINDTDFISNTSGSGGGGADVEEEAYLTGGLFQDNHCTGTYCDGGGVYVSGARSLHIAGTWFLSNTAQSDGGGAYADGDATLIGGLFQNNRAANGGGLTVYGTLTLTGTRFLGNSAANGGGVSFTAFRSRQQVNAQPNYDIAAILTAYPTPGNARLVNALFARNTVSVTGAALYFASDGWMALLHTTIASPTVGAQEAVYIGRGLAVIQDTLVASYTTGIKNGGGTVFEDYNLFFNTVPTTGTVNHGGHSLIGNPVFRNPAGDDYHLAYGSAAIDAGVDVGVTTDLDGVRRPQGHAPDIGAYEYFWRIYLPIVVKPASS